LQSSYAITIDINLQLHEFHLLEYQSLNNHSICIASNTGLTIGADA